MRIKALTVVALILGVLLVTSVALANYPADSPGVGNTDAWVMNVHGTLDANAVASSIDQDGYASSYVTGTIAPLWNASFASSASGLDSGWLGSMTIDSLRPVVSVGEAHWEDVTQGDGYSAAVYLDAAEGANEVYFSQLFKTPSWRSIITIQCLDTEACEVSMTYRERDGDTIDGSPFQDTIEAFSQETYDLWDSSVNPNIPNDSQMVSGYSGALQVTSTGEIAGTVCNHGKLGYALAYNASPPGTETKIYLPEVKRKDPNGNWTGNADWSLISVQNTNSFQITVQLDFYKRDGSKLLTFTDTIPAYTSNTYNTRYGGGEVDPSVFEALTDNFEGTAVVSSDYPIVGVCGLVRVPLDQLAGAYTGAPEGSAELVFPLVYRVVDGGAWRKYSGLVVQNVDAENDIDIWSYWQYEDSGSIEDIEISVNIPAKGAYGFNTRYGEHAGTLADLPDNWAGTVVVTTTSPLGVAGMVHSTITYPAYAYLTNYDGIPVE
jgi:hypothetical protein